MAGKHRFRLNDDSANSKVHSHHGTQVFRLVVASPILLIRQSLRLDFAGIQQLVNASTIHSTLAETAVNPGQW